MKGLVSGQNELALVGFQGVYKGTDLTLIENVKAGWYVYSNEDVFIVNNGETLIWNYGPNICTGGTPISGGDNSYEAPNHYKDKAFDNNYNTSWISSQSLSSISGNAYIGYQFSTAKRIKKIIVNQGAYDPIGVTSVHFQYYNGSAWVTTDTLSLRVTANNQEFIVNGVNAQSTQWRLLANANTTDTWYVFELQMMEGTSSSGQFIPSVINATLESQLQVIANGPLKPYGTYFRQCTGCISKKPLGWEIAKTFFYQDGQQSVAWDITGKTDPSTVVVNADRITLSSTGGLGRIVTSQKIDVTNLKKLYIEWDGTFTTGTDRNCHFGLDSAIGTSVIAIVKSAGTFAKQQEYIDVSNLTGQYFIRVQAYGTGGYPCTCNMYKVWGE